MRDSGLFYEAHLSRWYRGEVSRQQLEQEPQMWRTLRFTPVATAAQAAAAQATTVQTAAAFGQVTAPAGGAPLTPSAVVATATLEASRQASRLGEGEPCWIPAGLPPGRWRFRRGWACRGRARGQARISLDGGSAARGA